VVALALGIGFAALCLSGLVGWRWWLVFRREQLAHAPLVELESRLKHVEKTVGALQMAPLVGVRR
jgi:hypothetical protein